MPILNRNKSLQTYFRNSKQLETISDNSGFGRSPKVVGTLRRAVIYILLGSVDISLQLDNRGVCTDTRSFVGVGSPNPLFIRQRRFRSSVGQFSKIDVSVSRYESRPTIYNRFNPYGLSFATRVGVGRGNLAPTITDTSTNVNTP